MIPAVVRSALFVPATRLERIAKAIASGADVVIVDLEDAVAAPHKAEARQQLRAWLQAQPDSRVLLRINGPTHPDHAADLQLCASLENVIGVVVPKIESAEQLRQASACHKPLWPLIESARGFANLAQIASAAQVERLTYGALDLGVDLGLASGSAAAERILDQLRFALLLQSRLANLAPPLDSIFPDFKDSAGLARRAAEIRDMGFAGLLCIHPAQVAVVHQAFRPGAEELDWAQRILAASQCGDGVFVVDGQMIDAPVVTRAQRIIQRAE